MVMSRQCPPWKTSRSSWPITSARRCASATCSSRSTLIRRAPTSRSRRWLWRRSRPRRSCGGSHPYWRSPPSQGRHSAASASRRPRRRRRGPQRVPRYGCCTTRRCRHGRVGASMRSQCDSTANASGLSRTASSHRPGCAQPPNCRGCTPALGTGVHARRPADHPRVRRR